MTTMKEKKKSAGTAPRAASKKTKGGDEQAAIAMALYSYFGEQHDVESDVITIRHMPGVNSQWCSKILNMRNIR